VLEDTIAAFDLVNFRKDNLDALVVMLQLIEHVDVARLKTQVCVDQHDYEVQSDCMT
jgi:phosphate starvation-inducible protein PhoH